MVKTYLKYEIAEEYGNNSGKGTKVQVNKRNFLISVNNKISTRSLRSGIEDSLVKSEKEVSCFKKTKEHLITGHTDGSVSLKSRDESERVKTYSAHKSSVTSICVYENLLFTAAKDTKIYCWNTTSDTLLYCLSGHKNAVTKIEIAFIPVEGDVKAVLLSSSKDSTLKVWNFETQEVMQTVSDLVGRVYDFALIEDLVVVGGADQSLKVYQIAPKVENLVKKYLNLRGSFKRKDDSKVRKIVVEKEFVYVLGTSSMIEVFKCLTEEELVERLSMVKKRENMLKNTKKQLAEASISDSTYKISQKFFRLFQLENEQVVADFGIQKNRLVVALETNRVEVFDLELDFSENVFAGVNSTSEIALEKRISVNKNANIDFGHEEVLRIVKFGYKGYNYLTASNESVKLWNIESNTALRSIPIRGTTTATFMLDDKLVAVGTKQGEFYLFDSNSTSEVLSIQAHQAEIWNIQVYKFSKREEEYSLVSFSSDKTYKLWTLSTKDFQLQLIREMDTADALTFGLVFEKFIAYSQLDNSIKINFLDTNKQRLSLYGHKVLY